MTKAHSSVALLFAVALAPALTGCGGETATTAPPANPPASGGLDLATGKPTQAAGTAKKTKQEARSVQGVE